MSTNETTATTRPASRTSADDEDLSRLLHHSDWLRSLARAMVADRSAAEDLVQETWLAALRNPPDPARPARPWLAGVMRNLVRLRARTDARRHNRDEQAARADAVAPGTDGVEREELTEKLTALVMELDEPYRTTLVLHFFHELPTSEIARRERVSAGTVRWRVWRGLGELRARLDSADGDRRSWMPALAALAAEGEPGRAAAGTTLLQSALAWKLLAAAGLTALAVSLVWRSFERSDVEAVAFTARAAPDRADPGATRSASTHRVATSPSVPSAATATLTLLEHDGRPAAGWPVVVVLDEADPVLAHTSADGLLSAEILAPGAHLFLGRPDAPVTHVQLPAEELPRELRLARGAMVEGRVTISGRVPREPLELCLTTDLPMVEGLVAELGLEPDLLSTFLGKGRRVRTRTGEGGSFRFHGLPRDWSGLVVVPPGMRIAHEVSGRADARPRHSLGTGKSGATLHFDAPMSGLWFDLEPRPGVRGRIVDPETGAAVAGAQLRRTSHVPGGRDRVSAHAADEHGHFDLPHLRPRTTSITLDYWDPDGRRGRRRELALPEPGAALELGDLPLAPRRGLAFVVRDVDGQPVSDAVAAAAGVRAASDPTGADGSGWIEGLAPEADTLSVRARGYVTAAVPLPTGLDGQLEVELTRTTRLALALRDPEGAPLTEVRLHVRADGALYHAGLEPAEDPLLAKRAAGEQSRSEGGRPDDDEVTMRPDGEGRVVLDGLRDGQGLFVAVLDRTGRIVLERELPSLAPAEWRAEELRVEAPLRELIGRIEIAGGGPLAAATVIVSDADGGETSHRTAADGTYRVPALSSPRVSVWVSKPGFMPREIEGHALERDTNELNIALARAPELLDRTRKPPARRSRATQSR